MPNLLLPLLVAFVYKNILFYTEKKLLCKIIIGFYEYQKLCMVGMAGALCQAYNSCNRDYLQKPLSRDLFYLIRYRDSCC